jgi:hypothetical protein
MMMVLMMYCRRHRHHDDGVDYVPGVYYQGRLMLTLFMISD